MRRPRPSVRAQAVASAQQLLIETGPEFSMDEVCRAAGCSKGALYHHFDSRAELLIEALERCLEEDALTAEAWVRLLPLASRDSTVASLLASHTDANRTLEGTIALGRQVEQVLGTGHGEAQKRAAV